MSTIHCQPKCPSSGATIQKLTVRQLMTTASISSHSPVQPHQHMSAHQCQQFQCWTVLSPTIHAIRLPKSSIPAPKNAQDTQEKIPKSDSWCQQHAQTSKQPTQPGWASSWLTLISCSWHLTLRRNQPFASWYAADGCNWMWTNCQPKSKTSGIIGA